MRFLFIVLLVGLVVKVKAQDTLYIKGAGPLLAKVIEAGDDFVTIRKTESKKTLTEKSKHATIPKMADKKPLTEQIKVTDIKAIRYKGGYTDYYKADKYFYAETVQLIDARNIPCVVIEVSDDSVKIDTDNSLGFLSIPYDSIANIVYRTGLKEPYHELIKPENRPAVNSTGDTAIAKVIDTAKAFKFLNRLNNYTINEELDKAKGNIEDVKTLFDRVVRDEKYRGGKDDSVITEIILEYCRLFDEVYFSGKKNDGLPAGEGKLYKPNGEIQSGIFLNGKLSGKGTVTRNAIIEKEGNFSDGELNGEGTTTDSRGRVIRGIFVENQLMGQGSITFKNGAYEKGQYIRSRLTGEGERHLQNNNFYTGSFKSGKYGGHGVYHWADQDISYEGDFEDGKRNGNGILKLPGGITISGAWKNDCPAGKMDIQSPSKKGNDYDTASWVIKDCKVESKKNNRGRVKLEESLLFIKITGY